MMIGERNYLNPTIQVPPWNYADDPTATTFSSPTHGGNANFAGEDYSGYVSHEALMAFRRYLPSNLDDGEADSDGDASLKDFDISVDTFSCDEFRMFEFKIRRCPHGRSHDWTECPYAHPGEKARRRDPRKFHYSGTACPDFRKGNCKKGDACEFAHGVFECWLHPSRYRTQPCKDGVNCRRRVCFFAHTPEQLRMLSPRGDSSDASPHRLAFEGSCGRAFPLLSTPEEVSPPSESPPMSPLTTSLSRSLGSNSMNETIASLRQLQLNKIKTMPSSLGRQIGSPVFGSPRLSMTRSGYLSVPSTPTNDVIRPGNRYFDRKEEPLMERVASGRELRAKMYEKLGKENPLDRVYQEADPIPDASASNLDLGWVTDLVKEE